MLGFKREVLEMKMKSIQSNSNNLAIKFKIIMKIFCMLLVVQYCIKSSIAIDKYGPLQCYWGKYLSQVRKHMSF